MRELARIIFEARGKIENCIILDLSDTGARLLVNDANKLPKSFLLFRKADLSLRDAVVVRREHKIVGVRFEPPLDMTSDRIKILRKYKDLAPLFTS